MLLEEKMAVSKDGTIYLNDTDMKTIIKVAQKEDHGVKISISQEGMKSYQKKLHERDMNESGKVVVKADKDSIIRPAKQAANAPSPFTTLSLFYDEKLVPHEILWEKKFDKILADKGYEK